MKLGSAHARVFAACFSILLSVVCFADSPADFDKSSLTLRTALHYDPTVEVPLTKLIELYRSAGRTEELIGLYHTHLAQFPQDANTKLVLSRLFMALSDRCAAEFLRAAVTQHPDHAALAWQHARFLNEQHDPKTVEEMARAVSLEKSAARRTLWFGEMMKAAAVQAREDLVLTQCQRFIDEGAMSPEQRLRWARQALTTKLAKAAALLMQGLNADALGTDSLVEATMLRAEIFASNQQAAEATRMLDGLLGKLAPEHWRRREILMLRLDVAGNTDRDELVKTSRAKWEHSDGKTELNALTLADVLEAAHRNGEALGLLREAATLLPQARGLEAGLLDLWEKEGVDADALAWIEAVLLVQPDRADLRLRRVQWLFASNHSEDAKTALAGLLQSLTADQQVERSVELARWLRRRNQLMDASALLEAALERAPARWDLRRELGELYFAQRRKDDASQLFAGAWTSELAPDARLEVAQFLMAKQLWLEAKSLMEPWLAKQPASFEGLLLFVRILDKLGDEARVVSTLEQARTLCDTDARYQAWLETACEFAEAREQIGAWIALEAGRLTNKESGVSSLLGESTFARWFALIEQAKSRKEEKLAEEFLHKAIETTNLSAEKRLALERVRLELLSLDSARAMETETGLRKLMEQDTARADDYRSRLVLLYQRSQRDDLAFEMLQTLDPAKCSEVESLRALLSLCLERGLTPLALASAERLTRLEPGERTHWSQWLGLLAQDSQEERLRVALREVMGKAHDWRLKPEVIDDLSAHFIASHWRSVLTAMMRGDEGWAEARRAVSGLLDASLPPEQVRWAEWLAGYLSVKLKDDAAVATALNKLDRLDAKQWIVFPDGLELSVREGRRWLRTATLPLTKPPGHGTESGSTSPAPPFEMRWAFILEEGRMFTKTLAPPGSSLVFLCDNRQTLHALDRRSGKLRWSCQTGGAMEARRLRSSVSPAISVGGAGAVRSRGNVMLSGVNTYPSRYGSGQPEMNLPIEFSTDGMERLCYLSGDAVFCVSATTGELLWRAALGGENSTLPGFAQPHPRLALAGERVIAWQPAASSVSAFDLKTGKLVWQTDVPAPPLPGPNASSGWNSSDVYAKLKSGLSVEGGQVFVFAQTAAMLDAAAGAVRWRLSTGELLSFPIDLRNVDDGSAAISLAMPQTQMLMVNFSGRSTLMRSNFSGFSRSSLITGQRWSYGNGIRAMLQGGYAGHALLHGDAVWSFAGSGGSALVSVMGLPIAQPGFTNTVVGFAGGAVVALSGSTLAVFPPNREAPTGITLFPQIDAGKSDMGSTAFFSAAVASSRVYACNGSRLRAADARSGVTLFDVPLPEDMQEWMQQFQPKTPAMPVLAGNPFVMRQPLRSNRVALPQGSLVQDERGGGTFCENTAAVVGDDWFVPVNERTVVCLRGADMNAPATPLDR